MLNHSLVARQFSSLSDKTRLAMCERLGPGPSTVSELARPLDMSLSAVMQHLQVLEQAGVVVTQKVGRVRTCALRPGGFEDAYNWIRRHRHTWDFRLEALNEAISENAHQERPEKKVTKQMANSIEVPNVIHGNFSLEREFGHGLERVFSAWSRRETKREWFTGSADWEQDDYTLDFRVGGVEHAGGTDPNGTSFHYDARYEDIVPLHRIVTTYQMRVNGELASVSVATVEFEPIQTGTRLTYTEQGAFLDGLDSAESRRDGTEGLLGALSENLDRSQHLSENAHVSE